MLINDLMEKRHLTKYQLAKETGIPYTTISDICNGKAQLEKSSGETLYKISAALSVSIETLLSPIMKEKVAFENNLRNVISKISKKYNIKKVSLFGSRATGTNRPDSDVDLIIEFYDNVSLLTLSSIKNELEASLKLDVDVIHGPIQKTDLIKVKKVVEIFAA